MGVERNSEARSGTIMALLLLALLTTAFSVINCSEDLHIPKHDLNTDTMITLAGYQAETHKVVTPDGYILTLYRIVGNGPVVFMQHGLEDSSAAWVIAGPDHGAPAFRLAAEGYDVWLGNYRGNHDSREHQSLDADRDNEFWQFSWDEMAKYDLPTELNFVMNHTNSQKVELAVLLAPVA